MITRGRMKMPEIAVVTGGSAGIGRATAIALTRHGYFTDSLRCELIHDRSRFD